MSEPTLTEEACDHEWRRTSEETIHCANCGMSIDADEAWPDEPAKTPCPECGGLGEIDRWPTSGELEAERCPKCCGTGIEGGTDHE